MSIAMVGAASSRSAPWIRGARRGYCSASASRRERGSGTWVTPRAVLGEHQAVTSALGILSVTP